jgi:hypothetical protein
MIMANRKPCQRVWLCATQDRSDLCYRHYHNCYRAFGHPGECQSGSGPEHHSGSRVGDVLGSIGAAYAAMEALGWRP